MKHLTRLFGIALCALLIFALLPMVTAQVHAEAGYPYAIDTANFPDKNFRDYVLDNYDTDGNGKLSQAEAEAVTSMDINSETTGKIISDKDKISGLTGIQYFTKLQILNCSNNELAQPDFSKNTELDTLICNASNVAVLDLSKNTKLTDVELRDNHLGALDISKNTKLTKLDIGNKTYDENENNRNHLKQLDTSKNTALFELYCYKNDLAALDITGNTALAILDCSNNKLAELDLSKSTSLDTLDCHGNLITKLDITKTALSGEGYFGAHAGDKTVTVTMTSKQSDYYEAYGKDDSRGYNNGVKVHVHTYKNVTVRATAAKAGYTRKECACGHWKNKVVIPAVTTIKLSPSGYLYDGNVKTPSVVVKDSEGNKLVKDTDYTVSYATGRKSIGKYKVTVVLQGKYAGSKVLTFNIKPGKTAVSSVTAKKAAFTVKWAKKTKNVDGYIIQYSSKSDFSSYKTVKITSNKTVSKTITGLKAKKTYYVRVATYKNVGKSYVRSDWSAAKSVMTKK